MKSLCGEPVCLWLPEKYREEGTSEYVQGVEVDADFDGAIPELAISVYPEYRGMSIGKRMMTAMIDLLKEKHYAAVSLSVQKKNFAVRLYRELGFEVCAEDDEDYVMVCQLEESHGHKL